jgi:hypothetical protein
MDSMLYRILLILLVMQSVNYAELFLGAGCFASSLKDGQNRLQAEIGAEVEQSVRLGRFDYGISVGYARSVSTYNPPFPTEISGPRYEAVGASLFFQVPFQITDKVSFLPAIGGTGKWIRARYSYNVSPWTDEKGSALENSGTGGGYLRAALGLRIKVVVLQPFARLCVDIGSLAAHTSSPVYPSTGLLVGVNL